MRSIQGLGTASSNYGNDWDTAAIKSADFDKREVDCFSFVHMCSEVVYASLAGMLN